MEDINHSNTKPSSGTKALWMAVAGLALVTAFQWHQINTLGKQNPSVTDSVVIVDFFQMSMMNDPAATDAEIDLAMVKVRENIQALTDAGFVVLDAKAVIGAPSDAYLHQILKSENGQQ